MGAGQIGQRKDTREVVGDEPAGHRENRQGLPKIAGLQCSSCWFVLTHQGYQAIMPLPGHLPASVTFWGLLTWGVAAKQEAEASPNLESKGGMLRPRRTEV